MGGIPCKDATISCVFIRSPEIKASSVDDLCGLLELGGFPEPFLGGSKTQARRWSREYRTRLVREDLVSLERVQDLGNLELLMLRLPDLVGSDAWQLSATGTKDYLSRDGIRVSPALTFLRDLV
jgi:hypothetical protein